MRVSDLFFRIGATVRHWFMSVNTLGYGIHSPYLYNLVRFIFYDNNAYYCYKTIETERQVLLRSNQVLDVEDLGVGNSEKRRVAKVATTSLIDAKAAQLLFRMVNSHDFKVCIELGTCLGITTAYLSVAEGKKGKVYTFEGSEQLASVAQKIWKKLKLDNIELIKGDISVVLEPFLEKIEKVDFAVIDANHTYEATLHYFNLLARKCGDKSIIVLDDINYSRQMLRAWQDIRDDERVHATIDCGDMGFVFFNTQLMKKHYKIRL